MPAKVARMLTHALAGSLEAKRFGKPREGEALKPRPILVHFTTAQAKLDALESSKILLAKFCGQIGSTRTQT